MSAPPADWYPSWWPPKVGDKLRHFTLHSSDTESDRLVQVHALVHVVAVFEHDGDTLATVAEWWPGSRRWNYETIRGWAEASSGESYWPNGQKPTRRHGSPGHWCDCCKDDT